MTWFERLTGFAENSPEQVRANLECADGVLRSLVNGRSWTYGELETPSVAELRERVRRASREAGRYELEGRESDARKAGGLRVREVVADVQELHRDEAQAGALFQVASQFNLLEMVSPHVTPEQGVGRYEGDRTQGPACAVAAGAGTIYRNYFAEVNGRVGQTADNQIDCLADLGAALGNAHGRLWEMQNGYALPTENGLAEITERLRGSTESERDGLRGRVRIGLHRNTQVTLPGCTHLVTQAYCSALPVAYSNHSATLWEEFACLILEAAYEATLCAGILNARAGGNPTVFLTLLGEGAFGNRPAWVFSAIRRALRLYRFADLDLSIVSYRRSRSDVRQMLREL